MPAKPIETVAPTLESSAPTESAEPISIPTPKPTPLEIAQGHADKAIEEFDAEDYETAIVEIPKAVQLSPELAGKLRRPMIVALQKQAAQLYTAKQFTDAIDALHTAIEWNDADSRGLLAETSPIWLAWGETLIKADQHEQAIGKLTEAIRGDAKSVDAYRLRAQTLTKLEKHDQAAEDLEQLAKLTGETSPAAQASVLRGIAKTKKGDFKAAIAAYRKAADVDSENQDRYQLLITRRRSSWNRARHWPSEFVARFVCC